MQGGIRSSVFNDAAYGHINVKSFVKLNKTYLTSKWLISPDTAALITNREIKIYCSINPVLLVTSVWLVLSFRRSNNLTTVILTSVLFPSPLPLLPYSCLFSNNLPVAEYVLLWDPTRKLYPIILTSLLSSS
jgi:hypothetical protein